MQTTIRCPHSGAPTTLPALAARYGLPLALVEERPILFNGEMVRALLGGRKTQTRRIVKPQPTLPVSHFRCVGHEVETGRGDWQACDKSGNPVHAFPGPPGFVTEIAKCPYGKPGNRLWVRETLAYGLCSKAPVAYRATHKPIDLDEGWDEPIKWTPSIHMPRGYSRITLEIVSVRIERLQDISERDAIAEGAEYNYYTTAVEAFRAVWESINGSGSWAANPWVWVVEFKRAE